ncbi:MAG TPA: NADH-quinone oxidoreductase subunit NuoE [Bacillota bacterium]|nr:NADH-quinone oxidoreductase subunit NuoE [Bacillota bacterium]HOK64905.1 NADH-quinone oxidoreductase subunit NuoE [Bacillota bacterium]HOL12452.1 NADH-quinone oxidoreductase subunit NuoE [Bacillota bacterium]HOQ03451.1 NADH-quinone oxidoreductase subunit NuoE [Bacillota bacterium]HPP61392.1 NADH-quinone oxidoreductase subunit NuoE [Bacillota bacterium]
MAESNQDSLAQGGADLQFIDDITEKHSKEAGNLLPVLREVQQETGYLTEEALIRVAENLDVPLSQVYGVATFYHLLTVKPKGKYIIRICQDGPCHVLGAQDIYHALEENLGIKAGENTEDGLFTLEFMSCVGLCGVAPVIMINEEVYGKLTPNMIPAILGKYKE